MDSYRSGAIVTITAVVTANSLLLSSLVNEAGKALTTVLTIAFIALPLSMVLFDLVSRAVHNISVLRSLGAKRGRVLAPLLALLMLMGVMGTAMGSVLGVAIVELGLVLSVSPTMMMPSLQGIAIHFGYTSLSSALGITLGTLAGVRRAWKQ